VSLCLRMRLACLVAALVATTLHAAPAWTPQTSGVTARLRGVSAVNDRVVWASGANGTILRTTDGGERWQKLGVPPDAAALDFRDIDAVDERTAYALSIGNGAASRIYKTVDAGATWTLQFTNTDEQAFFDAMAFWNAARGVAFSDSVDSQFVVVMTANGGRTWTRVDQKALPPALPNEGAYAASGTNVAVIGDRHVWIATSTGRVLHSADGGQSWTVSAMPLATGQSAGPFSIAFRDATHGVSVGGDYRQEGAAVDNAAITVDGGRTWQLVKGLSGFRSVVRYVPRQKTPTILAVGPSGADLSTDDGRTWQAIDGQGFDAFSFAPSGVVGWGTGSGGRIGRFR
jgi:photosystem II stability/assembly factor-like uncharacterized protein